MDQSATSGSMEMNVVRDSALRSQLTVRRERLETALSSGGAPQQIEQLLQEVDAALNRMNQGSFGICDTCNDTIENDRLIVDPLLRNCLDHLSPAERRSLEADLDLARAIQQGLLPERDLRIDRWTISYQYHPAGSVSGDYCDIIRSENEPGTFYFLLGDVSGKGFAASLLMSHLHAIFRSLIPLKLPIHALTEKANRVFCEGTLSTHFATLVAGKASANGEVEICNAGHCFPLHICAGQVCPVNSTGLPLGLMHNSEFTSECLHLRPGDALLLYTDGLSETRNKQDELFGEERLVSLLGGKNELAPAVLVELLLKEASGFRGAAPRTDDMTVVAMRHGG